MHAFDMADSMKPLVTSRPLCCHLHNRTYPVAGRGNRSETTDLIFMNTKLITGHPLFVLTLALLFPVVLGAQDQASPRTAKDGAPAPSKPGLSQEQLEAKFKATLTKATLSGRWCSIKGGKLTPEKDDRYTILGVSKIGNDAWMINARIQYGQKDMTIPLPVLVKWAGDTAVITVDNMGLPGGGNSYSARVLIYDKTYAGTWSGGDHGGLMNGIITNEASLP
jgi:hypothetical protein